MKFNNYSTNTVYELEVSNGNTRTVVVTDTKTNGAVDRNNHEVVSVVGYKAKAHDDHTASDVPGEPAPDARLIVYDERWAIRPDQIVAKRRVDHFTQFEAYYFPNDAPTSLLIEVPEDKRDRVKTDFDYNVVSCPSCEWEDDVEHLCPGDRCPSCGTGVVGDNRGYPAPTINES